MLEELSVNMSSSSNNTLETLILGNFQSAIHNIDLKENQKQTNAFGFPEFQEGKDEMTEQLANQAIAAQ